MKSFFLLWLILLVLCGCNTKNQDGFIQDETCIAITENTPISVSLTKTVADQIAEGKETEFFEANKTGELCENVPAFLLKKTSEAMQVYTADVEGTAAYLVLTDGLFAVYNGEGKKLLSQNCKKAVGGFFSADGKNYVWQKGYHEETGIYHSVILYAIAEGKLVQTAEISRYGTHYKRLFTDCPEYVAEAVDAFAERLYQKTDAKKVLSEEETLENGVFYADFNNDGFAEGYFRTMVIPKNGFSYIYPELLVNETERMPFEEVYPLGLGDNGKIPVRFWMQEFGKQICIFVISEESVDGITKEKDGFVLEGFHLNDSFLPERFICQTYEKEYAPKVRQEQK